MYQLFCFKMLFCKMHDVSKVLQKSFILRYGISFISIAFCLVIPSYLNSSQNSISLDNSNNSHEFNLSSTNTFKSERTFSANFNYIFDEQKTGVTRKDYLLNENHLEIRMLLYFVGILSATSFIQLYFYYKTMAMIGALILYIFTFLINHKVYATDDFIYLMFKIETLVQMFFFIILLHIIDRRVSFV